MAKRCPGCKQDKETSEFWKHKGLKDGLQSYCKPCWYARTRRYQTGPAREKWLRDQRNAYLKRTYGITFAEFEAMEKGGCAICGRDAGARRLHVDHCHKTGKVRGLLCHYCNLMVGHSQDNPETLEKAAEYLRERG